MNPELSRSYSIDVAERAVRFPPRARRLLVIGIGALLLLLVVWLIVWLQLAHPLHPSFQAAWPWLLLSVLLAGAVVMLRLPLPPRSQLDPALVVVHWLHRSGVLCSA